MLLIYYIKAINCMKNKLFSCLYIYRLLDYSVPCETLAQPIIIDEHLWKELSLLCSSTIDLLIVVWKVWYKTQLTVYIFY